MAAAEKPTSTQPPTNTTPGTDEKVDTNDVAEQLSRLSSSSSSYNVPMPKNLTTTQDVTKVGGYWVYTKSLPSGWECIDRDNLIEKMEARLAKKNVKWGRSRILRCLMGRHFDMDDIEELLVKRHKWAIENNIAEVRRRALQLGPENLPHSKLMSDLLPFHPVMGFTKDGNPVCMWREGSFNIDKALEYDKDESNMEKARTFFLHVMELFTYYNDYVTEETGRLGYLVQVHDLNGIGMSHVWNVSLLKKYLAPVLKEFAYYYVDGTQITFMNNTPLAFRAIWSVVSLFLNERQINKCRVHDSINPDMFDYIDKDVLPDIHGGTRATPKMLESTVAKSAGWFG